MLTPAQITARKGKLTASRIAALMTGDTAAIMRLYRELIGEVPEEDLSDKWPVQLGAATEPLNLRWYERRRNPLSRHGEVVVHPCHDWAACTLDAWDDTLHCPVETKHVAGHEPIETVVDRYQPQFQWQMECTTANQCALSIIIGASMPIVEYIERDAGYAAEMVSRGKQLMFCVRTRTPPLTLPAVSPPAVATKHYEMLGDNRWASAAATWLSTKAAAGDHAAAGMDLKEMVPADARKVTGYGVVIVRNRIGYLSLREII